MAVSKKTKPVPLHSSATTQESHSAGASAHQAKKTGSHSMANGRGALTVEQFVTDQVAATQAEIACGALTFDQYMIGQVAAAQAKILSFVKARGGQVWTMQEGYREFVLQHKEPPWPHILPVTGVVDTPRQEGDLIVTFERQPDEDAERALNDWCIFQQLARRMQDAMKPTKKGMTSRSTGQAGTRPRRSRRSGGAEKKPDEGLSTTTKAKSVNAGASSALLAVLFHFATAKEAEEEGRIPMDTDLVFLTTKEFEGKHGSVSAQLATMQAEIVSYVKRQGGRIWTAEETYREYTGQHRAPGWIVRLAETGMQNAPPLPGDMYVTFDERPGLGVDVALYAWCGCQDLSRRWQDAVKTGDMHSIEGLAADMYMLGEEWATCRGIHEHLESVATRCAWRIARRKGRAKQRARIPEAEEDLQRLVLEELNREGNSQLLPWPACGNVGAAIEKERQRTKNPKVVPHQRTIYRAVKDLPEVVERQHKLRETRKK